MNDWMSRLDGDKMLKNVTLPGSHDAGTWDIHICSPWNSARQGKAANFAKLARYTTPCTNVNYSKVQNIDLVEQFKFGIRYYDLRVAKHEGNYRFTHGLLGSDFLEGFKDLVKFSERFDREILVCDIRFIYGFDDQDHQIFQDALLNIVGDRLADTRYSPSSKLSKFWKMGKNVVIIYHSLKRIPLFWNRYTVTSEWLNTTDPNVAISKMKRIIQTMNDDLDVLQGLQAVLTPDGSYIALKLWSSTQKLAGKLNPELVKMLKGEWRDINVSFIMYDVVEYPGLSDAIIMTNFS